MPSEHASDHRPTEGTGTDGDGPGFDERALYRTVRQAVTDAILDAVGTILLVAVGTAVGLAGTSLLVRTVSERGLAIPFLAAGIWLVAIGFYVVASTLGIVQPVRDWF